nr:molybdopterin converting factor subunit 1 [Bacillus sonorensis]
MNVIKILLFAGLAEQAGTQSIMMEEEHTTTDRIRSFLKETYQLQGTDRAMIAVNEVYKRGNSDVKSGDTVAFIPPVSGG